MGRIPSLLPLLRGQRGAVFRQVASGRNMQTWVAVKDQQTSWQIRARVLVGEMYSSWIEMQSSQEAIGWLSLARKRPSFIQEYQDVDVAWRMAYGMSLPIRVW